MNGISAEQSFYASQEETNNSSTRQINLFFKSKEFDLGTNNF